MALTDKLTAIAEAIREKTGKTDPMTLAQMPKEIAGISGSGGGEWMPVCQIKITEKEILEPLYYHSEPLQPLPAEISEHPYAVILKNSSGLIRLLLANSKCYVKVRESDGENILCVPENFPYYNHSVIWCPLGTNRSMGNYEIYGNYVWVILWSNFDIPWDSPEGTNIHWRATEPQLQQPAETSRVYYNGELLPKIPETLLAEYPYAWIRKNTASGYFDLLLSDTPFYRNSNSIKEGAGVPGRPWYRVAIETAETATEWTDNTGTHTYTGWTFDAARRVFWSNHNIPDGSATTTNVYFYATTLVPEL